MAPKRDMKPGRQCRANLKQLYTVTSQVTRPTSNSLSHGCPKIKYLSKKHSYSSPKIELLWHSTYIQCMHWSRLQMLLRVYWDNIVLQLIWYNGTPYHFFSSYIYFNKGRYTSLFCRMVFCILQSKWKDLFKKLQKRLVLPLVWQCFLSYKP